MTDTIAYLVTGLDRGGAEIQVVELASRMRASGWKVHLISLTAGGDLMDDAQLAGIKVHSLGMGRGIPDPFGLLKLRRILVKNGISLIHSHMVHANILGRLCKLIYPRLKVISTAHNVTEGGEILELMYRFTDRLAIKSTHVGQGLLDSYIKRGLFSSNRSIYVPNGIDTSRFEAIPDERMKFRRSQGFTDEFVWLCPARFEPQKDHLTLLKAYKVVLQTHENSVLCLAGAGSQLQHIQALVAELQIEKNVRFLGKVSDMRLAYGVADAVILSSAWEGLPLALLEAAASSLPLVATYVGSVTEIIQPGRNGFLCPPCDPLALTENMLHMMGLSDAERLEMGHNARKLVEEKFSINTIVSIWQTLYRSVS